MGLAPVFLVYVGFFAVAGMSAGNSENNQEENGETDQAQASLVVLLMIFGFAFNSSHFCVPLIKEREFQIS
jgi:hypothetical protein